MDVYKNRKEAAMKRHAIFAATVLFALLAIPTPAHARYRDGMNLYQYVRSNPQNGLDPTGLATESSFHWEKIGENLYKATKDGAKIAQLSQFVVENDKSWRCVWPIKTPDEQKSRKLYSKREAACNDVYDISNLTAKAGPKLEAIFVDKDAMQAEALWYSGYTKKFATGPEIGRELKKLSGEGATPIDSFTVFSHGGIMRSLSDGGNEKFGLAHLPESQGNPFDLAKQKKGPKICWFRPGAKVRFIGCHTAFPASVWADNVLRSGRSPRNFDRGVAHGTTRWLQVIIGQGGRLLDPAEAALTKINALHPNIQTPGVGFPQLFNQAGWKAYPAKN